MKPYNTLVVQYMELYFEDALKKALKISDKTLTKTQSKGKYEKLCNANECSYITLKTQLLPMKQKVERKRQDSQGCDFRCQIHC